MLEEGRDVLFTGAYSKMEKCPGMGWRDAWERVPASGIQR